MYRSKPETGVCDECGKGYILHGVDRSISCPSTGVTMSIKLNSNLEPEDILEMSLILRSTFRNMCNVSAHIKSKTPDTDSQAWFVASYLDDAIKHAQYALESLNKVEMPKESKPKQWPSEE